MAGIFKRKWTEGGQAKESSHWYTEIVIDGNPRRFKLFTDKAASIVRAGELLVKAERGAAGLVNPYAAHNARPIAEHTKEYTADLTAQGCDSLHVKIVGYRLAKLVKAGGWIRLDKITADTFSAWRGGAMLPGKDEDGEPTKGLAAKTVNEYLAAARAFACWCVKRGRMASDPLATVGKTEQTGHEVRVRRALADDEIGRLLAVAGKRKVIYMAAILTGLRRAELEGLVWDDVKLDTPRPFLKARAATTKNGKDAIIWLRDDLAAELKAIRPDPVDPSAFVLRGLLGWRIVAFNADLAAAGIPEVDGRGRRADFHALRHTLATNLSRAGIAPRVSMEVMRHSSMSLTMKTYTDAGGLATGDAVECLPRWNSPTGEREKMKATGTDDVSLDDGGALTRKAGQKTIRKAYVLSSNARDNANGQSDETPVNIADNARLSANARVRTDAVSLYNIGSNPTAPM